MTRKDGLEILPFTSGDAFAAWLQLHHAETPGLWVQMYKKHTGRPTVVWAEAVEAALCYGWIDSVMNKPDEDSFIQRFTPRRSRSIWSKKNCQTVERLIAEGRMQPAGLREVERAKADGHWDAACDSPKDMQIPQDFSDELNKCPKATETFASLNKSSRYLIAFHLNNAKRPATWARRPAQYIAMLDEGRKPN